ncbi:TonB-dependent receptor [Melioribacter sp. OK-6-Me]|uniref:TonB-dependent receptor n=1 Tax=unclassified Melioribacter TaxID=2627329 RepID=UPI003ED92C82
MNTKLLFCILLFLANSLFGQDCILKGKVTDSKNGNAIQNAVVFISYNYMAYTNSEGYYEIKDIPEGIYKIKISRLGYKSFSSTININSHSSTMDFILEPSPIELDEVIVSTDRTEKYLRNSPYSELLVGKEQLESKPFNSLSEVLKTEAGISLLRDGIWGTEVSIRGLNRENVVTLIDGNRIATSTDIAARLSMINTDDIERVEIIKGASSSIYGSGATGGILNIITKSPQLYDKFFINGNISTGYNSVNNLSAFSGTIYTGDSFWSTKLAGSYRKANNTQTPAGELKNSQFEDYSFSGSLNVLPFDNHKLKIDYQLFKANDVGIPGASVFPTNADVRYPNEKRELISAAYEIQNISRVFYKLSVKYAYQFIVRNVENIPHTVQNIPATGTTPARRVSVLKITPAADHKNNNIQIQGNFFLGNNNSLIVGIDYWDRSYNGHREKYQMIEVLNAQGNVVNTTNKVIGEKPLPDSKFSSLGMFAQDNAELIKDKLTLTLGARYDVINISGETTLNPVYEITNGVYNSSPSGQKVIWNEIDADDASYSANAGLKYSLNSNLDFTLGLGLSFRSPSLEERFQYIDQGSFVRVGNPNLESEKGKSIDLGIRYYTDKFKMVSSVFYNHFDNLVSELPGTFETRNAFIKTNIGEARIYGLDVRADYNFYINYVLYVTASYVKGDDITSGGHLPEIPPLNGNLGIKFNLLNKLTTDVSASIFAEQNKVAAGELTTPGYAVFNLSLNSGDIKFSVLNFRIFAGVENIFNKEYRNHLSTTRGLIVVEPGRNFFIKLIADF